MAVGTGVGKSHSPQWREGLIFSVVSDGNLSKERPSWACPESSGDRVRGGREVVSLAAGGG